MVLSKIFNQFTASKTNIPQNGGASGDNGTAVLDLPPLNPVEKGLLEEEIIETLRNVYDPEIPVNIYDMGLIYEINISNDRNVEIKMTLTSPGCPVAGTLPPDVERRVRAIEGVVSSKVELVWEPTWTMDFMTEEAKLELGLF